MILEIEGILKDKLGQKLKIKNILNLSGGDTSKVLQIETNSDETFILKYNLNKNVSMFEAEAKGLSFLSKSSTINFPKVYAVEKTESCSYIILEFINSAEKKKDYWVDFSQSLAALHQVSSDCYGFDHNNYIGSLNQSNLLHKDWVKFFRIERLTPQVQLALSDNRISSDVASKFEKLYDKLPQLLFNVKPALLHGDLWNGNVLTNSYGKVALIDPAVYFGNREVEIAFTGLFGGFDKEFYSIYHNCFPLENGYKDRFEIYNLYPLMVHVNLFGGSYVNAVIQTLNKFI
jgi:fructosamine-3-kinase